ncbi:MAG: hypothetical protein LBC88_01445 [Spirochaetaceae bacterium]|jgi:hypothetical protein|nr:hypothetical protein [Spirochaetaceae bacterium]
MMHLQNGETARHLLMQASPFTITMMILPFRAPAQAAQNPPAPGRASRLHDGYFLRKAINERD